MLFNFHILWKNYSLLLFLAFGFVSLFFFSNSCSATSQSITLTNNDVNSYTDDFYVWYKGDSATESRQSVLSFRPLYVEITGVESGGSTLALQLGYKGVNTNTVFLAYAGRMKVSLDLSSFSSAYAGSYVIGSSRNDLRYYLDRDGRSLTFTFYDSVPEGCPEPDPCPDIPEDSQTLLDIKNAILYIPAMMIVIYFFFIMFSWYLGVYR